LPTMLINATVCRSTIIQVSLCQRQKLAIVQRQKIDWDASLERPPRRVDGFVRQLEGAVVDPDAGPRAQDVMRPDRSAGEHVHAPPERARLVLVDRQEREPRRAESFPDLCEVIPERGVAGKINGETRRLDDVSAPEGPIAVEEAARGKVERRHAMDRDP